MNTTPIEKARTIHIRDLFITICQRWRSLLICLVIGAIVLGAYGWWKSGDETSTTPQQAAMIGEHLGEVRKGVIESYASDIISSTQQLIWQGQYNKESLLMQLDPFHLSVCELSYYVDDAVEEGQSGSKRFAIAQAYLASLQKSFLGQKVTTIVEGENSFEQKDFFESPQLIQIDKGDLKDGVLTFRLFFSENANEEDVNAFKKALQTAEGSVQGSLGYHIISLIGESTYQYADLDILSMQESNTKRINDICDRIDKIKKAVTDSEEKKYLNYLVNLVDKDVLDKNHVSRVKINIISVKNIF